VNKNEKPIETITRLYEERLSWSDDAILEELAGLAVLPDEDDPAWAREEIWQNADLFIALAKIAASRRLHPALLLLLERASYGDPGEMMRGLRHNLERIVEPDWDLLMNVCITAAKYPQAGARLWAVRELGILRDGRPFEVVISALEDPAEKVRCQACSSLVMICQSNPQYRMQAIEAIRQHINHHHTPHEIAAGTDAISDIEAMDAN
jgi:hypothetical protein